MSFTQQILFQGASHKTCKRSIVTLFVNSGNVGNKVASGENTLKTTSFAILPVEQGHIRLNGK